MLMWGRTSGRALLQGEAELGVREDEGAAASEGGGRGSTTPREAELGMVWRMKMWWLNGRGGSD
jgi:hypothetical protein